MPPAAAHKLDTCRSDEFAIRLAVIKPINLISLRRKSHVEESISQQEAVDRNR